ncbi:MAG: type II toxin-antitoxin system HicB family antitoxin [Bryobacteraceae bacterium]
METVTFFGVVHKDKRCDYGVSFPDFPGCIAAESEFDAVIRSAKEALEFHIEGMIEDGEAIPNPSRPDQIAEEGNPIALVPIDVQVPRSRVKRFNIAARETDIRKIDRFLRSHGRNKDRSSFLVSAALTEIKRLSSPRRRERRDSR